MTGLEPARAQCPLEPESSASASSATSAHLNVLDYNNAYEKKCQALFPKNFQESYSFFKKEKSSFPKKRASALLRMTGLEPARAQCPLEPESSASASSATSAHLSALDYNNAPKGICQHIFLFFHKNFDHRKSGTRTGTTRVQMTPLTKASTAVVALVFLLMMPNVVSMAVAPAGAMAQ